MLPNGLTVIVAEDHRTDTVALHVSYGVGGRDEKPGEFGCAHLFEHLMFEGSAHVPNNAFDSWLTAAGGDNNAYTSSDETAYHMTFPRGALDLALFLESDRMGFLDAGIDEANVKNQIGVVLQERAERYGVPNGRDWSAIGAITYPADHPYGHSVIGTVADVEGFTPEAVLDFWKRHYRPRNAVLAVVGAVETEQALERIRFWFSDVPDPGPPEPRVTAFTPSPVREAHGLLEDDVEERTLWLVWPGVPRYHADEPALDVLANLLSNGRGTRLDDALYYESKLASDVGLFTSMDAIDGQVIAVMVSERTPLAKLEKKATKVLLDMVKRPPTQAEIDRARVPYRSSLLDVLEDPASVAETLVSCQVQTGEADCLGAEWARYEKVTPDDVVRVLKTYLLSVPPSTLSNVPRGDDGALEGATPVELP